MNLKTKGVFFCLVAGLLFSCNSFVAPAKETKSISEGIVLDLGEASNLVQATPEYSNAVMAVVLPRLSDAANRLNLPVPRPITHADIARIHFLPFLSKTLRNPRVSILLKNDWAFTYSYGYVSMIANGRGYSALQDPDLIPFYYGKVNLTKEGAIQFARDSIKKLGIPLEDVFAEQEPHVTLPAKLEGNTVPHYEIQWVDPRADNIHSADIHINAETKQIERIYLFSKNLERPFPKIDVVPTPAPLDWPSVNPEYAWKLIPLMFKAIDEYAQKLSLPVPHPLTTNNVARVEIHDNEGWPHAEIWTTNGWRFIYRHTMVNGYYAPDNLFASDDRKIHIKDFEGKWNLTTNQAIETVRQAIEKLAYPTNNIHMADAKTFIHGAAVDKAHIPRLNFEWYYETNDDLQSRLEAEVNMDTGKLESLYYDDKAYWNSRPPIDAPISFPLNAPQPQK